MIEQGVHLRKAPPRRVNFLFCLESDLLPDCFGQVNENLFVVFQNLIVPQQERFDLFQVIFDPAEPSAIFI